ncbi:MAG: DUF397 domain-containing protein [Pseudonocardiaceae bacterium]
MDTQPSFELVEPWRASSYSNGGDNCVEFARSADGWIGIRDSKNPDQPPHVYSRAGWMAFVAGVKNGELDG